MGEPLNIPEDQCGPGRDSRPGPAESRPDEAVAGARRVRWCARLAALVLAVVCVIIGGRYWLSGALLGGLVVEINLGLITRTLSRAAGWRGRSMWSTLIWFYLCFGLTIVACVLVVRNHFGHPLAFLLGLLSFFIGLALALLSWAFSSKRLKTGSGHE